MIYYVEDMSETISFYHSLLKENGRLMILLAARRSTFCSRNFTTINFFFFVGRILVHLVSV